MLIRPATDRDAPGAADVVHTVFDEYGFIWEPEGYHADLFQIDAYYTHRGHRFWVAEDEGRVVGTVALELFPRLPGQAGLVETLDGKVRIRGCDCALERLYVHPSARRQGLGDALFQTVLTEARALSREALEIWSDKRFQAAHRLYQRLGARVVGERICDDPDLSPEWGLLLPLEP